MVNVIAIASSTISPPSKTSRTFPSLRKIDSPARKDQDALTVSRPKCHGMITANVVSVGRELTTLMEILPESSVEHRHVLPVVLIGIRDLMRQEL